MSSLPRTQLRRELLALLGAVAFGWLLVMLVGGDSGALALVRAHREHTELQARVERLETQNDRLRVEIRALEENPDEIERIAREELMMARPGEEVILVPDVPDQSSAVAD